ncbi:nicotinate-nucleotide--dimethylbenzimidazole phosphoribosyltransferase [Corynebacterium aquatimens]|uniref:Nicotinate-nucleotide--dimethylbenzimidazole phosphoribosyltransferase n=1 Tax=Corynebacterium aquatimens TaxID=1190508 RepID=A0A931GW18_9CORY|nr:nicotinate-nucleotide--dimethylbenzimidazole phosphoribosyltransferase [Corynebacterium aquatimens]MBG6121996.1 nicotinate-nucleotide--dimethylbenzimidazole phosphoribosyltransferase [Corynebacterium aquatimens]WJY65465.1 Nicotinate-nucleotide--dimethylbenzimidazole phosphoribosyltransferase [Corynebacterium aquatimens]
MIEFPPVPAPDVTAEARLKESLVSNPRAMSYGRLAQVAAWLAGCQGTHIPQRLARPRTIVFAGDHGIASRGVSAFTPEASVLQAEEMEAGSAPVNTAARIAGSSVRLVDVSLNREPEDTQDKISLATRPFDVDNAMDDADFLRAAQLGVRIADQEIDSGADFFIIGDLGVGNTTVAAAVMATFAYTEPVKIVGRGSGINDEVWKVKVAAVRDAMFRVRDVRNDLEAVLTAISSPDFVAAAAFMAQAAVRSTPMLIDGAFTAVAAYIAERLAPGAKQWMMAGQLSPEPCHAIAVQALDLTPLAALDITTGQGVGALTVFPAITATIDLIADEMRVQEAHEAEGHAEVSGDEPGWEVDDAT